MSLCFRFPPRLRVARRAGVLFAAGLFMTIGLHAIHVRDFGAVPNDGRDQAAAIQRAIEAALASGQPVLEFDAGDYVVTDITRTSPYNDRKVCLLIDGANGGLTLRGAVGANGRPATALIYNEPGPRYAIDYWMWISRSKDVTVENLIIDFPGAMASGRITKIENGRTWVDLWPEVVKPRGFLKDDAEYIFLYDPATGEILHDKITLGGGWDEMRRGPRPPHTRDRPFASVTDGHGIVIDAEVGAVGMGLACPVQWHHAPERTFMANHVENLTLRNIVVVQALGHCFVPVGCKNITVQNFRFDPAGRGANRGWCARRDGLTMRACRGHLLVEDSMFQGMSDDLLAFWGWQFQITEILSPTKIVVSSRQAGGDYLLDFPAWIEAGDWIEFRQPGPDGSLPLSGQRAAIRASEYRVDRTRHMPWRGFFAEEIEKEAWHVEYVLELNEPIPEFVADAPLKMVLLGFTLFEQATLRRVTTRNVTNHPGVLIPGALDYLIEDCTFGTQIEISANPATRAWHGGAGIWNATIRRNTFTWSPIVPARKGLRAEGVHSVAPRGRALIEDNTFVDDTPLTLGGSQPIAVRNNRFVTTAAEPPITLRNPANAEVRFESNAVVPPESAARSR